MNVFTIKDIENLSGIKAHTIRIWEQRYSFLKPLRTNTNIRFYSNEELKTILNIALLNKYGYKISHINKMSADEIDVKILKLTEGEANVERLINNLIQEMIDLDIDKFEKILDNYIYEKGIEKAITQIIFPFLERIGILWVTNHINPAQEHLVSNIIRQKLIAGIEATAVDNHPKKTFLLFLPEGEHHELGLLFMYFLMKKNSIKVWYLGANTPLKDVKYVAKLKQPDFLYAHLTAVAHNFNFDRFLTVYHNSLQDMQLIVSGRVINNYKKKQPSNIHFKTSFTEVIEFATTI